MIDNPTQIPASDSKPTKLNTESGSPELRRLFHELMNSLTVLNFSCVKIREAVPASDRSISIEIGRMEKTIADMTFLVENTSRETKSRSRRRSRPLSPASVFPLFRRNRHRR